jgi:hypothetical protein
LPYYRLLVFSCILAGFSALAVAASPSDDSAPDLWDLPVMDRVGVPQPDLTPNNVSPNCSVAPLPELQDEETVQFEKLDSPETQGLLPEMAQALGKFRALVAKWGGSFDLKSAYRPTTYQEHLQQVWYKWMRELRFNRQLACQALRAQVAEEFTRHKLMPTQIPVTDSDHTRGMAFDAAISMPGVAKNSKKRRVGIDYLAKMAGLMRPDVRRDPVHFKLIAAPVHVSADE